MERNSYYCVDRSVINFSGESDRKVLEYQALRLNKLVAQHSIHSLALVYLKECQISIRCGTPAKSKLKFRVV